MKMRDLTGATFTTTRAGDDEVVASVYGRDFDAATLAEAAAVGLWMHEDAPQALEVHQLRRGRWYWIASLTVDAIRLHWPRGEP